MGPFVFAFRGCGIVPGRYGRLIEISRGVMFFGTIEAIYSQLVGYIPEVHAGCLCNMRAGA